jgi:hypothetical protein
MCGSKKSMMRLTDSGAHGLLVAHLADQDHIGVLTQHVAKGFVERRRVAPDLALGHHGELVVVHELDRIFDRDDVLGLALVDPVEDRRERGRLARSRRACDQDQTAFVVGDLVEDGRQVQVLEALDEVGDGPARDRELAALLERVDAEADPLIGVVGEVHGAGAVQPLEPGRVGQHLVQEPEHVLLRELPVVIQLAERAVHAHDRRRVRLQVQVGCAQAHHH